MEDADFREDDEIKDPEAVNLPDDEESGNVEVPMSALNDEGEEADGTEDEEDEDLFEDEERDDR